MPRALGFNSDSVYYESLAPARAGQAARKAAGDTAAAERPEHEHEKKK
jgi:hypothetical protein